MNHASYSYWSRYIWIPDFNTKDSPGLGRNHVYHLRDPHFPRKKLWWPVGFSGENNYTIRQQRFLDPKEYTP